MRLWRSPARVEQHEGQPDRAYGGGIDVDSGSGAMKPALFLLAAAALLFVSLLPAAATELSGETLLFISDT